MSSDRFSVILAASRRTARLGLLLALATVLYVVEAQLPLLPLPGARLGLANLVTLLALYGWGLREAFQIALLRQVLGGMFTGTLLGMPFFFGLAGAVSSTLVMALLLTLGRGRTHPVLVSIWGAIAHNMAQLGVAYLFIQQRAVLAYLPFLLYLALPSGAVIGYLAKVLLPIVYTEMGKTLPPSIPATTGLRRWAPTLVSVVFIGLFVVYTAWPVINRPEEAAAFAVITVDGKDVVQLPLDQDTKYQVPVTGRSFVVQVENNRVRVLEADCPDQVCVLTGHISRVGQAVVCVPNRVTIRIQSAADGQDPEIDGMTW
ncbi:MAG TPA: hypothetical protein GXZ82_11030 [Firmicutes bacterium]|nr:hypothetical protein [Bacillota bacterium]